MEVKDTGAQHVDECAPESSFQCSVETRRITAESHRFSNSHLKLNLLPHRKTSSDWS